MRPGLGHTREMVSAKQGAGGPHREKRRSAALFFPQRAAGSKLIAAVAFSARFRATAALFCAVVGAGAGNAWRAPTASPNSESSSCRTVCGVTQRLTTRKSGLVIPRCSATPERRLIWCRAAPGRLLFIVRLRKVFLNIFRWQTAHLSMHPPNRARGRD